MLRTLPMTPADISPQARLAASRKALVRQMAHSDGRANDDTPNERDGAGNGGDSDSDSDSGTHRDGTPTHAGYRSGSVWQVLTEAVTAWWQHHPAHVALDVGRPFLRSYAREKPLQLLGIAAGLGAAAVLVKPWRLVSFTGLAVAALKSTKLSSTLLSLLSRQSRGSHQDSGRPDRTTSQTDQTMNKNV